MGSSIAGTLDYAAPEQMGRLPGVEVGPPADVYGFAKTCWYALFRTPQMQLKHSKEIPTELAELLDSCMSQSPTERPQSFASVMQELGGSVVETEPRPVSLPPATESTKPAEHVEKRTELLQLLQKHPEEVVEELYQHPRFVFTISVVLAAVSLFPGIAITLGALLPARYSRDVTNEALLGSSLLFLSLCGFTLPHVTYRNRKRKHLISEKERRRFLEETAEDQIQCIVLAFPEFPINFEL